MFFPTTNGIAGQLVVMEKTSYGFTVKELNGTSSGKFDWLAIARRKGYEGQDISKYRDSDISSSGSQTPTTEPITSSLEPSPSPTPESTPTPSETPSPTPTPDVTPSP